MKQLIILIIMIIFFSVSYAQTDTIKKSENTKIDKTMKIDNNELSEFAEETPISIVNFFMAMSFVIGLIFLATYLFKRFSGFKVSGTRGQRVKMSIISTLPLGDKKFLFIVEIQGQYHFIGVTPSSISYMSDLSLDIKDEAAALGDEFVNILDRAKEFLGKKK